jgi:hypothetical protein
MRPWMSLLLCLAAQAAIVPSLSVEELVDRSEIIVHGRVTRSWPAWDGAHKYIWTHHEVEIIDPIRGAGFAPVVVSEPGGALDGVEMRFSGALPYALGEEAVVFLYRTPVGYWRTQGKYTVTSGTRVRANLRGASLSKLDDLPLVEFKARVRELVARRK